MAEFSSWSRSLYLVYWQKCGSFIDSNDILKYDIFAFAGMGQLLHLAYAHVGNSGGVEACVIGRRRGRESHGNWRKLSTVVRVTARKGWRTGTCFWLQLACDTSVFVTIFCSSSYVSTVHNHAPLLLYKKQQMPLVHVLTTPVIGYFVIFMAWCGIHMLCDEMIHSKLSQRQLFGVLSKETKGIMDDKKRKGVEIEAFDVFVL